MRKLHSVPTRAERAPEDVKTSHNYVYANGHLLAAISSPKADARNGTRATRLNKLPASLAPRGLSREEAAAYVGMSPSKFDQLVDDGRMPKPKAVDGRRIWDRFRLDTAFAALPDTEGCAEVENDIWSQARA